MKCKKITIFLLFFCSVLKAEAQFKHYLSLNTGFYNNYFNKEKDIVSVRFPRFGFYKNAYPNLSYKIEHKKIGIECFYTDNNIAYYYGATYGPAYEGNGSIRQILSSNIGIAVHYNILDKAYLKICPLAGVVKNSYDATIVEGFFNNGWNESIVRGEVETKLGMLTGVNINVPIWRGIYANTNARYSFFPTAQYNKQNLILDFGIGYMYQNNKKDKSKK